MEKAEGVVEARKGVPCSLDGVLKKVRQGDSGDLLSSMPLEGALG
jgi:hypothetical protein